MHETLGVALSTGERLTSTPDTVAGVWEAIVLTQSQSLAGDIDILDLASSKLRLLHCTESHR